MADHRHGVLPLYGHLPPRRAPAWAVSVALHAAVLGMLLWLVQRTVIAPPAEPARMVFVEPAPPPPPPLGAPVNAPQAPVIPEPAHQQLQEIPKPQRLVVPPKKTKAMPTPVPAPMAIPKGLPEGSAGGVAGGVLGGEAGGKVGGVVGGHGDEAIPADRIEHPPIVVARVLPDYPSSARARGLEGRVLLRAVVDRSGHVEEAITVVESSPLFDAAAVEALR